MLQAALRDCAPAVSAAPLYRKPENLSHGREVITNAPKGSYAGAAHSYHDTSLSTFYRSPARMSLAAIPTERSGSLRNPATATYGPGARSLKTA
jgi:hypothetical protein